MRRIDDPRIRQALNQISQNIESANAQTQASLYSFSQQYLNPCLSSITTCLEASCQPCFTAARGDHERRPHHRRPLRGREGFAFDFYDDWEQDEAEWGNDELDRLLSGEETQQPGKHGKMSYGSRTKDRGDEDPNIVPQSSIFGFLERLPWKIGGRGTRYRPGVADLQENVGRRGVEAEPLIADEDNGEATNGRSRSGTVGSRETNTSLSSRGDLFPSEDEDDAVPLDDEFAMVLERRTTGTTSDDHSSKRKGKKRPDASRASTKSTSTRETRSTRKERRGTSTSSGKKSELVEAEEEAQHVPSMDDLKQEEERLRKEEETQVESRRQAAQRLALERGLSSPEDAPEDLKKSIIVSEPQVLSPTEEREDHQPTANPPPPPPPKSPIPSPDAKPSEQSHSHRKSNPDPEPKPHSQRKNNPNPDPKPPDDDDIDDDSPSQ